MTNQGTILVVDDTPANLKLLADTLTAEGYQVLPADSGELALAAIAAHPPELILLDIRMPGLDGFEVFRRLKSRPESRDIPIMLISAFGESAERVEGLKLGAVDFISKPFQHEELLARVQTHMELRHLRVRLEQQAADLRRANEQLQTELAERQRSAAASIALNQEMQASRRAALNLMDDAVESRDRLETANQELRSEIVERKLAEAALRASEERFHRAVLDSPFPILLHAEDGAILQASNSWCEITGYTREELATIADWTERAYGERKTLVQTEIDALYGLDHRKYEGDYTIRTKPGETKIWEFSSAPLGRLPDGRRLVISMAMDVTDRRAAEREVRRLNAELEQRVADRTAQLEAANQELEAFSFSVSHDLRAPLRGIDGWAQALLADFGDKLGETGRQLLERQRAASQRMGALIDDLLRLSHLTRQPLTRQTVSPAALVSRVWEELRPAQPPQTAELVVDTLPDCQADSSLLTQVFANLLGNALKFSSGQAQPRIEVGGQPGPDHECVYFVKDNGAGFDMRYASKLFGAFQRLHSAHEFPGTGIGLAIVQRIIRRHGGRIWAESAVGQGATFFFTLSEEKAECRMQNAEGKRK